MINSQRLTLKEENEERILRSTKIIFRKFRLNFKVR